MMSATDIYNVPENAEKPCVVSGKSQTTGSKTVVATWLMPNGGYADPRTVITTCAKCGRVGLGGIRQHETLDVLCEQCAYTSNVTAHSEPPEAAIE